MNIINFLIKYGEIHITCIINWPDDFPRTHISSISFFLEENKNYTRSTRNSLPKIEIFRSNYYFIFSFLNIFKCESPSSSRIEKDWHQFV